MNCTLDILGFDCETTGLDPLQGQLALVQINHSTHIELYEPLRDPSAIERVRSVLEQPDGLIVGHNLKFDAKWACTNGIMPPPHRIFDTMIASQLIYAGIQTPDEATLRSGKISKAYDSDLEPIFDFTTDTVQFDVGSKSGRFSHSLQAVLLRELGVVIKKEMQTSDWSKPLSAEQREYAKSDVKYLPQLYQVLKKKLDAWGLTQVAEIEMRLVYTLAYLEMVGAKIDRAEWQAYATQLRVERDQLKRDLEYKLGMKGGGNHGLFGMVPDPVNADSNVQLLKIFKLPNMQNETVKKAIEKPDCDPLLREYADYKAVSKLASTYGDKYLSFAWYRDRLRGEFTQASTATGRLSSRNPNQQNIPPKIIKSNLRAEEGYEVFQADYSQVELKILANLSGDKNFLKTTQESDVHEANARLINNIPDHEPVPKELRRKAKVLSFSIPYGVSAVGLWQRDLAPSVAEAKVLLEQFYSAFPGVKKYLERQQELALKEGFTRDAIGRIRRYEVPEKPKDFDRMNGLAQEMRSMAEELQIEGYQDLVFDMFKRNSPTAQKSKDVLLEHFSEVELEAAYTAMRYSSKVNSIRREAQNHGIQATSASITKLALVNLQDYLQATGYGYITLTIHDSIFFELKREYMRYAVPNIIRIMEEAGKTVLGENASTPVDGDAGWMEKRPCSCCGEKEYFFNRYLDEHFDVHETKWDEVLCEECVKLGEAGRAELLAGRIQAQETNLAS